MVLKASKERELPEAGFGLEWSLSTRLISLSLGLLAVTGIIYLSGGALSPFLFLYLPLTMAAAFLLSRSGALLMATVSGLSYSALIVMLHHGIVTPFHESALAEVPTGGLTLQIIGLCSAMVLIGVATSYLLRAMRSARAQVAETRRDLAELSNQQAGLINSIPKGIVTTQLDGKITNINQAALELFHITEKEYLGTPVSVLLQKLDPLLSSNLILDPLSDLHGEFDLSFGDPGAPLRISYHGSPILNPEGEAAGMVLIFQDVTKLRDIEEQLALQDRMARLLAKTESDTQEIPTHLGDFVGESKVMQKIFALIERVAPSDATVLIHGESGTGKELVARAIHRGSSRSTGPFIPVNCGAIPESLIESELFGHKKGAFTSAHADAPGLFRQASGGTIFLDEIGELPVNMQAKLLRAIQERNVRPVGGDRDISIDVRIVAATNKNLKNEIQNGQFREDLYYRLNVISINLPSLRERRDDIPLLVHALLRRLVQGDLQAVVPPNTMQLLTNYNYPGNVRELENILERAFVLGGEVILPEHLPEVVRSFGTIGSSAHSVETATTSPSTTIIIDENISLPADLDSILASLEQRYLEAALVRTKGGKKKAADLLGINFRSLRYRLQKFGIAED